MTDHHPLQRTLAIMVAAADIASKRVEELERRQLEVQARVSELGNAAAAARATLRDAAGANAAGDGSPKDVTAARKALRDADGEYELATVELEGIGERVVQAEREFKSKRRSMSLAGVDVCQLSVAIVEEKARAVFARFADLMRHRHQLAKLAGVLASEADGRVSEPIRYSDEMAGLLRQHDHDEGFAGVLESHMLTARFAPFGGLEPASLNELLEIELPRAAEAAE